MSKISVVAQYPEEGTTVLEDDQGKFVAFRTTEEIEEVFEPAVARYSHSFVRDIFSKSANLAAH
jgi:hypothetical protein